MGSTPFSAINFSINLLSKIDPETGDITGCSGTSFETETNNILILLSQLMWSETTVSEFRKVTSVSQNTHPVETAKS